MNLAEAKLRVANQVDAHEGDLWGIASKLYENPEVAFNEFQSAKLLTKYLEKAGFEINRGTGRFEIKDRIAGIITHGAVDLFMNPYLVREARSELDNHL